MCIEWAPTLFLLTYLYSLFVAHFTECAISVLTGWSIMTDIWNKKLYFSLCIGCLCMLVKALWELFWNFMTVFWIFGLIARWISHPDLCWWQCTYCYILYYITALGFLFVFWLLFLWREIKKWFTLYTTCLSFLCPLPYLPG